MTKTGIRPETQKSIEKGKRFINNFIIENGKLPTKSTVAKHLEISSNTFNNYLLDFYNKKLGGVNKVSFKTGGKQGKDYSLYAEKVNVAMSEDFTVPSNIMNILAQDSDLSKATVAKITMGYSKNGMVTFEGPIDHSWIRAKLTEANKRYTNNKDNNKAQEAQSEDKPITSTGPKIKDFLNSQAPHPQAEEPVHIADVMIGTKLENLATLLNPLIIEGLVSKAHVEQFASIIRISPEDLDTLLFTIGFADGKLDFMGNLDKEKLMRFFNRGEEKKEKERQLLRKKQESDAEIKRLMFEAEKRRKDSEVENEQKTLVEKKHKEEEKDVYEMIEMMLDEFQNSCRIIKGLDVNQHAEVLKKISDRVGAMETQHHNIVNTLKRIELSLPTAKKKGLFGIGS